MQQQYSLNKKETKEMDFFRDIFSDKDHQKISSDLKNKMYQYPNKHALKLELIHNFYQCKEIKDMSA